MDRALERAWRARASGDTAAACAALADVLRLAAGPLLPEDGPEEGVVTRRDHYRAEVSAAAATLAALLLAAGKLPEAVDACRRGIAVDRCSDRLWRLLAQASDAAGDPAAAALARRQYAEVLADLGVIAPGG